MNATVAQLVLYPVKGCRGVELQAATLTETGLEYLGVGDREWVVTDLDGTFVSQRDHPRLALVETRLTGDALVLRAPGMLRLDVPFGSEGDVVSATVWNDTIAAVTQGEVADAWFSAYLGQPARLLRFDPEHRRLASSRWTGERSAPFKFADQFPLLVATRASLDDLNARLAHDGHTAVGMERFRANIVLDGVPAYEEDYVDEFTLGAARLRMVKPCSRCTVPSVDQATGVQGDEPGATLRRYRVKPDIGVCFGMNAIVLDGAGSTVAVGDTARLALAL